MNNYYKIVHSTTSEEAHKLLEIFSWKTYKYFLKNWMDILDQFCHHLKPEMADYGISHTNHVESFFSYLKGNITKQTNINCFFYEFLLLLKQKRIINDKLILNEFIKIEIHPQNPFQIIYKNEFTGFAINFLFEIYKTLNKLSDKKIPYIIDYSNTKCEYCIYQTRFGLPCVHQMKYSSSLHYLAPLINNRWSLAHLKNTYNLDIDIKKTVL